MDIVNLDRASQKRRQKRRRNPERRHTTEVRFSLQEDQSLRHENSLSLSDDNISSDAVVDFNSFKKVESSVPHHVRDAAEPLSSSWNSLFAVGDFESPSESDYHFFEGSQATSFQSLVPNKPRSGKYDVAKHQYQLSYELALDNVLTPFADNGSTVVSPLVYSSKLKQKLSHIEHVIQEMVSTERGYIEDLTQVVDGYQVPLMSHVGVLPIGNSDLQELFGNIHEILDFHRSLLASLEESHNDPKKVAECFLSSAEDFKIYTHYCNNYPKSVNTLTRLSQDASISPFLKRCQQRLNHMLPLGAYLLKPVQRVLKYSLLLTDMLKHIKRDDVSYCAVKDAIQKMTAVAEHINSMKRKYDAAVHVQEIQSLLRGNEGLDLRKYGDLLHEDNFRYLGGKSASSTFRGRSERYVFLFQRLCLITKREEVGYQYKAHLEMKDLQLTEKIDKDPNSFNVRQVSTGRSYTFQARTLEQRQQWVHSIKLQLMESLPDLPDKAKELILRGFPTSESPSPRLRHRHYSEEPTLPSMRSPKVDFAIQKSKTLGHGFQPSSLVHSGKKLRGKTSSPNTLLHKQSTLKLVQASFTGLLAATVHQDMPAGETSEPSDLSIESEKSVRASNRSVCLKTNDLSESPILSASEGVFLTSPLETETSNRQHQRITSSSPKPRLSITSPYAIKHIVEGTFKTVIDEQDLESPTVEFEIVSTTFGCDQPDIEVHVEQDHHRSENDDEALFDELMSSQSDEPLFQDVNHCDNSIPEYRETSPTADIVLDDDSTPKASPSNIRRWSIAKRPSDDHCSADGQVTPKILPSVEAFSLLSGQDKKPTRRHSFGSRSQLKILHRKQESLSTDTTPLSSPYLHSTRKVEIAKHPIELPTEQLDTSIADLLSNQKNQVDKDRKSIILPPPTEFDRESQIDDHQEHFNPLRTASPGHTSQGSPNFSNDAAVLSPCHSNPDEMVTFDEILQNFDHYSDATGRTNRVLAHHSPLVNKKEKKKRHRNLTISDLDSTTVKLVKEEIRQYQDGESGTKVKKLAREYSQRIKDSDKSHSLKRFSQVVEKPPSVDDLNRREPVWLQHLRERKKSAPSSKASLETHQPDGAKCAEVNTSDGETETEFDPAPRKGRFRGWVKSLVDRFSTNK